MLEGLDAINWELYQGAYSQGDDIPKHIRALLSDNPTIRREAQSRLREDITHQGSVYPATIVVIPFLLEILESQKSPEPYYLLDVLDSVAENAKENIQIDDLLAYGYSEACLQIYQTILAGYPTYRQYLNYEAGEIRRLSLKLLAMNKAHQPNTRIVLRRMLKKEKSAFIKAAILLTLSEFMQNFSWDGERETALYSAYQNILVDYLRPENERLARFAAAIALNQNWLRDKDVKKQVLDIYFDTLKLPINPQNFADFSVDSDKLSDMPKPHHILEKIAQFDLQTLIPRLSDSTLSPIYVHYLGRELIDKVFLRITRNPRGIDLKSYWKWRQFDGWISSASTPLHAIYSVEKIEYQSNNDYKLGKTLSRDQRNTLEVIVNCDAFWEIKSNLFSFFYGLPDEREELRKLL